MQKAEALEEEKEELSTQLDLILSIKQKLEREVTALKKQNKEL